MPQFTDQQMLDIVEQTIKNLPPDLRDPVGNALKSGDTTSLVVKIFTAVSRAVNDSADKISRAQIAAYKTIVGCALSEVGGELLVKNSILKSLDGCEVTVKRTESGDCLVTLKNPN